MGNPVNSIAIGVRVGHSPDPAFFVQWTQMLCKAMRPDDMVLPPAVHLPHAIAANYLTEAFLKTECDALLFVDDDMMFQPQDVTTLRDSMGDYAVMGGLYPTRRYPFAPVCFNRTATGVDTVKKIHGITPCDIVGLGFTLVHRRHLFIDCFEWHNRYGEDGLMCERIKKDGGKIAVNADVRIGHRVTSAVYWEPDTNSVRCEFNTFGIGKKQAGN